MKVQKDEKGLYVLVSVDQLEEATAALVTSGLAFRDATDEGNTCSGPVYAWLRFPREVDPADVERALRELR